MVKSIFGAMALGAMATASLAPVATAQTPAGKPTIVLVHGAFADSSSWNGVVRLLERDGYTVVAAANPLRSVSGDARSVGDVVASISGPVVLVGHSYGGSVISAAAEGKPNVKALVYVAAFAPDVGETAGGLSGKFPGSTLKPALAPPVPLSGGGNDLYIQQSRFHDQFAADVPEAQAKLMAAGQRPIADKALGEAATEAAWKHLPTWFIYGDQDKNIPPQALAFMAERAHSRQTVVVKGGSHVVMVSHPEAVAALIEKAVGGKP
ncbi:alpha/beta fold hydrolase [Caulobacter hibisci]|uniref:Alpha/beta hydrolase n=1 Tax=Caulobacter hibisci TaxID=2035993 RepID=A0ABS0T7D3_9CAUL|nr:alpha/beta hydrolase [Caulobacter hibisci]MBI1686767.1 alpha/beta hydrolase [Caulobacter hibisci]